MMPGWFFTLSIVSSTCDCRREHRALRLEQPNGVAIGQAHHALLLQHAHVTVHELPTIVVL
jgi:hypothetical protein